MDWQSIDNETTPPKQNLSVAYLIVTSTAKHIP